MKNTSLFISGLLLAMVLGGSQVFARHLARRLSRELKTLAREKEALIAEVER